MKRIILLMLLLMISCGKDDPTGSGGTGCVNVQVQRAICFVDMMEVYSQSESMIPYAKNYCAEVYPTDICYLPETNWHN